MKYIYLGNKNCFWDFIKILIFQDLKNKVGLINWHLLILPLFLYTCSEWTTHIKYLTLLKYYKLVASNRWFHHHFVESFYHSPGFIAFWPKSLEGDLDQIWTLWSSHPISRGNFLIYLGIYIRYLRNQYTEILWIQTHTHTLKRYRSTASYKVGHHISSKIW